MSGQHRVFLNLCAGLDRLGDPSTGSTTTATSKSIRKELACIIGRPFVLDWIRGQNPILLGVRTCNHPIDAPDLFTALPVKTVLVPSTWYADMCRPGWPKIEVCRSASTRMRGGRHRPSRKHRRAAVRQGAMAARAPFGRTGRANPLTSCGVNGHSVEELRYGSYEESDYRRAAFALPRHDLSLPA